MSWHPKLPMAIIVGSFYFHLWQVYFHLWQGSDAFLDQNRTILKLLSYVGLLSSESKWTWGYKQSKQAPAQARRFKTRYTWLVILEIFVPGGEVK